MTIATSYKLPIALLLVALFLSACAAEPLQFARTSADRQLAQVERGLRPAVAIDGQPPVRWTLDERMRRYRVPGVSIALIEDFRVAWARGYGVQRTDSNEPVTSETLFQAASISKPVTAVGALRLVEGGKLVLDENVNARLRAWALPENNFTAQQPVTPRLLLSHAGGTTVHGFRGYAEGEVVPTLVQVLEGAPPANSPPIRVDRTPGSAWSYSGGGYEILQQLMQDVTGESFPHLMRRLVLQPLGMNDSSFKPILPDDERAHRAATGYRSDGTPINGAWHLYPELAAAGLWTTPTDLARFALGLMNSARARPGGVLRQNSAEEMLSVQYGSWGLGVKLSGSGRARRFAHGGANDGFRAYLVAFPETGQGAVVMTNSDAGSAMADELLRSLADVYRWPEGFAQETKTIVAVEAAQRSRLAGQYALLSDPGTVLSITSTTQGLVAVLPDLGPVELLGEAADQYFSTERGIELHFGPLDGQLLIRVTGGDEYQARRTASP